MHRIDHATAEADKHGSGKDGFTEGDPLQGIAATVVTDDWLDAVQEEVASVVERGPKALDKTNHGQLLESLQRMMADFAASNWEEVDTGSAANLHDVASDGDSNIVAVGAGGVALRSRYGHPTWSADTTGIATDLNAVAYESTGDYFFACGNGGKILRKTAAFGTSSWTDVSAGSVTEDLYGINSVPDTGLVTIVGASGRAMFTDDAGTSWYAWPSVPAVDLRDVAHVIRGGFTRELAVGANGTIVELDTGGSVDRTPAGATATFYGIAWDGSILGGAGGRLYVMGDGQIYESDDGGLTWTASPESAASGLRGVASGSKLTVGLHDDAGGPDLVVYDPDKVSGEWTFRSPQYGSGPHRLRFTAGRFWIPCDSGKVLRSLRVGVL